MDMKNTPETSVECYNQGKLALQRLCECVDSIEIGQNVTESLQCIKVYASIISDDLTEMRKQHEDLDAENTQLSLLMSHLAMPLFDQKDQQEIFACQSRLMASVSMN